MANATDYSKLQSTCSKAMWLPNGYPKYRNTYPLWQYIPTKEMAKNKVGSKNVVYESPIYVNSREVDRLVLGVTTRREMEEQTTMPSTPTLGWRLKVENGDGIIFLVKIRKLNWWFFGGIEGQQIYSFLGWFSCIQRSQS